MFYAQYILAKNGPLGIVWQAAHWDLKNKKQVNDTNIRDKVQHIVAPSVPISLRTSGHLLVGVVKIYSKKAYYLANDCNDALTKIKVAFKPGTVELELGGTVALQQLTNVHFDLDSAFDIAYDEVLQANFEPSGRVLVGRHEQITLDEQPEVDISMMELAEDVTNMGEGELELELELPRDAAHVDHSFHPDLDDLNVSLASAKKGPKPSGAELNLDEEERPQDDINPAGGDDNLNDAFGEAFDPTAINFEAMDLEMEGDKEQDKEGEAEVEIPRAGEGEKEAEPVGMDVDGVEPAVEGEEGVQKEGQGEEERGMDLEQEEVAPAPTSPMVTSSQRRRAFSPEMEQEEDLAAMPMPEPVLSQKAAPKRHKKTKLVVDDDIIISGTQMREQLEDTSDIRRSWTVAPRTRKAMQAKQQQRTIADVFSRPATRVPSHLRHLTTRNMVAGLPDLPLATDTTEAEVPPHEGDDVTLNVTLQDDLGPMDVAEPENITLELSEVVEAVEGDKQADAQEAEAGVEEDAEKREGEEIEGGDAKRIRLDTEEAAEVAADTTEVHDNVPDVADIQAEQAVGQGAEEGHVEAEVPEDQTPLRIDFDFNQAQAEEEGVDDFVAGDVSELKNKRTLKMMKSLRTAFDEHESLSFGAMMKGHNRRTAAAAFFEILALKTRDYIDIKQTKAFGDIKITKTTRFDAVATDIPSTQEASA